MASPNLSEIVTTTLANRSGTLADNVTKQTGLLRRLRQRGNVKPFSGGRQIVQELEYAENQTYKRYSGYETLDIQPSDVFTSAVYDIKQAAIAVSISGLEQIQNAGKEAIIDLLESRIKNAERTFINNLGADCYSDGTADGGKQIGGLTLLVSDAAATGTVGGINAANWPFWRNVTFDATTDGGAAAASQNIQSYMNRVYLSLVRQAEAPDLIVADNNYYRLYWESLQAIQRIGSASETASAGYPALKYMNADVIYDGGLEGSCPADHMYFLNTNYIFFRPHSSRNIVPLPGDRVAINQDAMVKLMAFAGNMTVSNRRMQGVLKD